MTPSILGPSAQGPRSPEVLPSSPYHEVMSSHPRTAAVPARPWSRLLAILTAPLLALLVVLGAPGAALAHDHLVSSDPADGAELDSSPSQITLTFSDEPLDVSPVITIADADGKTVWDEKPQIDGNDVIADLSDTPLPKGKATIRWRVVSADGHPIEGSLTMTVKNAPSPSASETTAAASTDAASTDPASTEATTSAPATDASQASEDTGLGAGALAAIIVIPLLVVIALGVWFWRRSRARTDRS